MPASQASCHTWKDVQRDGQLMLIKTIASCSIKSFEACSCVRGSLRHVNDINPTLRGYSSALSCSSANLSLAMADTTTHALLPCCLILAPALQLFSNKVLHI
ncbi:hypothetical protein SCP_0408570 [Sparassis crispa]|uniref:Uncharacterized protein n=1 Tax=Sparassis crispa TaxID=139825 RepID=A0A401GJY8_9APHY|nr:hypothetical protein SCP_0408570 [Sparassis crispa]GBE82473.1 hypothetical protein SCP_0408570 [Sparassis crispa]